MFTAELARTRHRTTSLGRRLERDRLAHRARRLEQVITALEARRRYHEERDAAPLPLVQALLGFRDELRETERALRTL